MSNAAKSLSKFNQRLKVAQLPVAIACRGQRLSLVATLPPKPNSRKVRSHQQRIALGIPANELGLKRAFREAQTLGFLLINDEFNWRRYLKDTGEAATVAALLKRFERSHRSKHKISDDTWDKHYLYYYKHLPQDKPLAKEDVLALVFAKTEHTRARQQVCRQMQKLLNFAEMNCDVLQFQGKYNSNNTGEKYVPSDSEILKEREKMRSAQWRWVFGMMAVFGLRDHECWYCHFTDEGLQVTQGKTGARLIELPLYAEWVEAWDLANVRRPKLNLTKGYKYLADQCGQVFERANVAFNPYALRYAYGHRGTVLFRYEAGVMARQMGHSLKVHINTYQRFLNDDLVRQKVREMKARKGLPKAPIV